jgi:uncharacterized protein (TIRG00374 family)
MGEVGARVKRARGIGLNAVRIIAAVGPFVWIYSTIEVDRLWYAANRISWWTVPFAFFSAVLIVTLQGLRMWVLLRSRTDSISCGEVLKYHLISGFYALALPTSAAQEVVRAAMIARSAGHSLSWGAAWVNRIIALIGWLSLSVYGLLVIDRGIVPANLYVVVSISFGAMAVVVLASFSKRLTRPLRVILRPLLPTRAMDMGEAIRNSVYEFRSHRLTVIYAALLTFGLQLYMVAGSALVIYGISGRFILRECLAFLPIIEIICVSAPLTPNSIGIREALLAAMYVVVGLPNEVLALYIAVSYLVIFVRLLGGIPVCATLYRSLRGRTS